MAPSLYSVFHTRGSRKGLSSLCLKRSSHVFSLKKARSSSYWSSHGFRLEKTFVYFSPPPHMDVTPHHWSRCYPLRDVLPSPQMCSSPRTCYPPLMLPLPLTCYPRLWWMTTEAAKYLGLLGQITVWGFFLTLFCAHKI